MTEKHHCHADSELDPIMAALFGVEELDHLNLFRCFKSVSRMLRYLTVPQDEEGGLSVARMRLLTRLAVGERTGDADGLPPSALSEFLGVSRNTVSALLNGLEEQELIARHLHPTDRRQFLIRLTPDGRALVESHAPKFAAHVHRLFDVLTVEERATLIALLGKLHDGLRAQADVMTPHEHDPAESSTPSTRLNEM